MVSKGTQRLNSVLINQAHKSGARSCRFVNSPIYKGTSVLFNTYEEMMNKNNKYVYGRVATPNSEEFSEKISALEGGVGAIVTSSGLSAISTALLALARPRTHILISESSYPGTIRLCRDLLAEYDVEVETINNEGLKTIKSKIRNNTAFVFVDIPGREFDTIPDLERLRAELGGIPLVVDNTYFSPYFFNPLKFGASVVIHSVSKYIAGHADVVMGCVVCACKNLLKTIQKTAFVLGQCASPEDLYLSLRGLRTLGVRLKQHYFNAQKVIQWLEDQRVVERVFFPTRNNPEVISNWRLQASGCGGVLSFLLKESIESKLPEILNNLNLIQLGWGWGGYESLASTSKISYGKYFGRVAIRLSVGLEDYRDIKTDLANAIMQLPQK